MRNALRVLLTSFVLVPGVAWAQAPAATPAAAVGKPAHSMLGADDLPWGPSPPALPPGASVAVLSGDPGQAGPFTIRIQFPANYKVPPHWHPTDEHVTVLEGIFLMGTGDKFDPDKGHALKAGGFAVMPAETRHFAWTTVGATVQVHGIGPFTLNYVNPADDPRTPAAAKPHH